MTPRRIGPCLALAVALAAGCSNGPREKAVFKARGRLTYESKPMAKAIVTFHFADPSDRSTPAHATADDEGNYVLHTYRADDGAPAGEYIVTIYWPAPRPKSAPKPASPDPEDSGQLSTVDRLNNRYSTVGISKLRATVEPRDNEINFNLP